MKNESSKDIKLVWEAAEQKSVRISEASSILDTVIVLGAVTLLVSGILGTAFLKRRLSRTDNHENSEQDTAASDMKLEDQTTLIQRELFSSLSTNQTKGENAQHAKIPCVVLCGPFGSGKTTTLRHLLREIKEKADFRCGAIVNDFSDLGVDVETIRMDSGNQAEASNMVFGISEGCFCCMHSVEGQNDLSKTISLLRKRSDIDCIIVETNGLTEAAGARAELSRLTRLDRVIGVIDGNAFPPSHWKKGDIQSFARTCDTVVINKSDVCSTSDVSEVQNLLKSSGARDVRLAKHGRIPISLTFQIEVLAPEKGELGTSLAERKVSTRYRLKYGIEDQVMLPSGITAGEPIQAHNLGNVQWAIRELSSRPIDFLFVLQDAVHGWNDKGFLERAKGRVWLRHHPRIFDFQFSGRCRLQLTAVTGHCARTSRLAIVTSNVQHDINICVDQELFQENPENADALRSAVILREWLTTSTMVTVLPFETDLTCVRFRVNCARKFEISEEDLQMRFGVSIADVNREFQSRCNCAAGSLLVAFDGEDCFIAPGTRVDVITAQETIQQELEDTVSIKFAVVKKHCRCDT